MGTDNQVTGPVIFFDGVCNLCNASINFIIRKDKKALFKFASLQSNYAKEVLPPALVNQNSLQSLVLLDANTFVKSTAALRISRHLSGLWPLLYGFIIVPAFIRHFFYDIIAKNRYRWFGKKDECMIPTPELRNRFID